MKYFAQLFTELDQTTKTLSKVSALVKYFEQAPDQDKLWCIALLIGKKPKRTVRTILLRQWIAEAAKLPDWLFEESYHVVGDLAETIALLHPNQQSQQDQSLTYWINYIRQLESLDDQHKKEKITQAWNSMDQMERFVFNKLITGGFRIGVSQKLLVRSLASFTGIEENLLTHRLMGQWSPDINKFEDLISSQKPSDNHSQPFPFFLAYALDKPVIDLGAPADWLAERKWDGIRGQIIVRSGKLFVWSRGEELVTEKFPEFHPLAGLLPDGTVLDGEILPFREGKPLTFNLLQTRIGRKNVTRNILQKVPVVMIVYDLLEYQSQDIRTRPLHKRRAALMDLLQKSQGVQSILKLSEQVPFKKWDELAEARKNSRNLHCEGVMLKKLSSPYQVGRKKGDWWKWKVDPLTIDAVLIYAMRGHGRRANLYTDYTFAVWQKDDLVPFTKAYSGLTDQEIRQVDHYVKKNTIDRFGPVRSVVPQHVFEIAFEGINKSTRHKSGVALRFPRINRWRHDKKIREANSLDDLHQLLKVYETGTSD
ncbi:MAG: ATP-dependent DNA ligase [Candidatus Cyclobacteriaceae bacterium M3_2C_046]